MRLRRDSRTQDISSASDGFTTDLLQGREFLTLTIIWEHLITVS